MMALKRSGWSEWRSYCGRRNCYVEMTSISVNEWFLTGKWMEIRKKVVRDGGCLNIFYYLCPRYIIKNSNIMSRIQSGPYQETLKQIETVQLCQNGYVNWTVSRLIVKNCWGTILSVSFLANSDRARCPARVLVRWWHKPSRSFLALQRYGYFLIPPSICPKNCDFVTWFESDHRRQ